MFTPTWYFLFMVKSTLKNNILGSFYADISLKYPEKSNTMIDITMTFRLFIIPNFAVNQ